MTVTDCALADITMTYLGETMSYQRLKELALQTIDRFSDYDIVLNYGTTYNANSKLDSIKVTAPYRAIMPPRVNEVFYAEYPDNWKGVRSIDTQKCESIGDFIKLIAKCSKVDIPNGEPT